MRALLCVCVHESVFVCVEVLLRSWVCVWCVCVYVCCACVRACACVRRACVRACVCVGGVYSICVDNTADATVTCICLP